VLETGRGFLSETDAIIDYLDESWPKHALFPQDPFARAKVRQLMKIQELYIETPVHNLIGVLFDREVSEPVRERSRLEAQRGLAALERLLCCKPWLCGEMFSAADIFVFYSFALGNRLTTQVYGWDMLQDLPALAAWYRCFQERSVTREVLPGMLAAQEALAARSRV
jgi:glutathione S-transferase